MAISFAHRWGQIIGDLFELSVYDLLTEVAKQHELYLDKKGPRRARPGTLVRWKDKFGNYHNLDYVLERGGSEDAIGTPVAFIEIAWRRYTKHSKAKAQEIEGALLPLSLTYQHINPLLGCMLAGDFTKTAISQLMSRDFQVLYFPSAPIFESFKAVGIDAASNETTPESEFEQKVLAYSALSVAEMATLKKSIMEIDSSQVQAFVESINKILSRTITSISITVLHGRIVSVETVDSAIKYIRSYKSIAIDFGPAIKFEVTVKYSNGDNIDGTFNDENDAVEFLKSFV